MTKPLILPFPGHEGMARELAAALSLPMAQATIRHFPDGETFVRLDTPVRGRGVIVVCSLNHPDSKIMGLMFLSDLLREYGAAEIGLVAPYLGYMRQDKRFHDGEAITSAIFARLLSGLVDWLMTVDPHLHRYHSLDEIYSIPGHVLHATAAIAAWIEENVDDPVLIGPDEESNQWVADVARRAHAPFTVLSKIRRGDRDVEVSSPELDDCRQRTPVLVDDIISTAHTMIETVGHLKEAGMRPPVCVAVHGIFAGTAYQELKDAGAGRIVTTNTIPHPSNAIDIGGLIAKALAERNPPATT